jgi:hypothetical protein
MNVDQIITSLAQIIPVNWLNGFAKKLGFCKRSTSRFTPLEYLRLMIVQASSHRGLSLNDCCNILVNTNPRAQMQPQSLWERINSQASVEFLRGIYEKVSSHCFQILENAIPLPEVLKNTFTSIIIEDSTCISLNEKLSSSFRGTGGSASKAGLKLHTIFNPINGECKILDVYEAVKTDNSISDKILEGLQAFSLIIRDLGFFNQTVFRKIEEKEAFFISRLSPSVNVYLNKDDKDAIDLPELMSKSFKHLNKIEIMVYLGNKERLPVRLIIHRVPEDVANKRRRKAKSKGCALKQAYSRWLGFTYFITNASQEMLPSDLVGVLYRMRWQIELMYKTWKSFLRLDFLNGFKLERIRALLYSKLITIMLIKFLHQAAAYFTNQIFQREISMMKLVKCALDSNCLDAILMGNIENLLKLFYGKGFKRLCKQKRKRKTTLEKIVNGGSYDLLA